MIKDFLIGLALLLVVIIGAIFAYNNSDWGVEPLGPGKLNVVETKLPLAAARYRTGYKERAGKFATHSFDFNGTERRFHIFEGSKKPERSLIVLLHGSQRTGVSMVDMWQSQARKSGALVVAPDSFSKSGWSFQNDPVEFIQAVIAKVADEHKFDASKIYLFGHSSGAVYAGFLSIQKASPFKAVAAHAGYPDAANLSNVLSSNFAKAPILFMLGTSDHIFNLENARQSSQMLSEAGQDVDLVVLKGHTHWYYTPAKYINEKAYKFFQSSAE